MAARHRVGGVTWADRTQPQASAAGKRHSCAGVAAVAPMALASLLRRHLFATAVVGEHFASTTSTSE
jgi:hypothetical protein